MLGKAYTIILSFLLILPLRVHTSCGPGTLRCINPSDPNTSRAVICDPSLNYVLFEHSCIQQIIANCIITIDQNQCKVCQFGYYLTNDRKCAAVPRKTPSDIRSCNFYSSIDECFACNINSYNRNGLCRPSSEKINDCTLMDGKKTCQICDLGLPSYNQTFCDPPKINDLDKCLLMRHPVSCKICQPGYKKDINYFLNFLSESDVHKSFFEKIGFWRQNFFDIVHEVPSCKFDYQIQDCEELDYDKKCKSCKNGFMLSPTGDRCFVRPTPPRNPKDRIPNCFKFKTENYEECDLCYEGFYLKDSNTKCVNHTETIPGCNVYSQTDQNRCIFCANVNYRTTSIAVSSQCAIRVNYFENCERYSRSGDKCLECAADHIFHFNNERCSVKIDNCNQYNITFRILQCQDCIDTHYLNSEETLCFNANGAISGCLKYAKGPSCSKCNQGYYLDQDSKTCFFHDTFLNCKTLSIITKNLCDNCNQQGLRTSKTHECTAVSNSVLAFDTNCVNWDEAQGCIECVTDYVLKTYTYTPEGSPNQITTLRCEIERGCEKWDVTASSNIGGCTQCATGYYLHEYSCNKPNTEFCMYSFETAVLRYNYQYGNNLESGFPCEICDEFRMYIVEQSSPEFRCIQSTFFVAVELVANCLSFDKKTSGGYDCKECRRNHVLNTVSNSCTVRTYNKDQTYYYDQKDRIVKPTNTTASVVNSADSSTESWPLNASGVAIDDCEVYGPGPKYCMKFRNRWGNVNSGSGNVMTEKKNYPYYDFTIYANYSTKYVIGDASTYTNNLAMDKSNLVANFTTFKHYLAIEDTGGTRKDQEPYIWYDTVPITKVYSAFVGYNPSVATYTVGEEKSDFKRVISVEEDGTKKDFTVCNKSIYIHETPANTNKDYALLRIKVLNATINDTTEPFKHLNKMKEDDVAPFLYPCDSTKAIENCSTTYQLIYSAERIIPLLSCFACVADYGVRLTQWKYRKFIANSNNYDNVVAETDCVKLQNSIDPNDIRMPAVANCFYFERVLHHVNNDIIHYCKTCQPGSYPAMSEEAPRCKPECSTVTRTDGLESKCDDWYQCSVKCPAEPCDFETKFCDTQAENIGCESKTKECCTEFISGEGVDADGNALANTSDFTCEDATRFKCRRKNCLNNCLDSSGAAVGLQCDTATNRCIPLPCSDPTCTCLKGACAPTLCRACTAEVNASTQYCMNSGGVLSCVDYNLCNPTVLRMLQGDNIFTEYQSSAERQLATITVCPPPCEATGTCTKQILDGYVSDLSYSGNDKYIFCNHYNGECTQLKSILEFVCECTKFEKVWIYDTGEGEWIQPQFYTKKCIEANITDAALKCICLGNNNYTNLDLCPDNGMPTWDPAENVNKPCESNVNATYLANVLSNNSCGWTTFKDETTNKTTAVNNAAAAASATANIDAAAAAAVAAGTAATESETHKTTAETTATDCATAQTANDSTATAAEIVKAEAALASAVTNLGTTTTEVAKAQASYDASLAEFNLNTSNADLLAAKTATAASLATAEGHKTTATSNKTAIETSILTVKSCHYTTVSTVSATEAATQATTAESQKDLTLAQEALALTAKDADVQADAEAAETAGTATDTASGAADTAAGAAATAAEDALTEIQTLLANNVGNSDLTAAETAITTTSGNARTSATAATASRELSAASLRRIVMYKQIILAKAYKATAVAKEAEALGFKTNAEGYLAAVVASKTANDQAAADTNATGANTSATSATSSSTDAGSAASSARNLATTANAVTVANSSDTALAALNVIIEGYATDAETSATTAQTHASDATTAATSAQAAASAVTVFDYSADADAQKVIALAKKNEAETAETAAGVAVAANDPGTAETEAGTAKTAATDATTASTTAAGYVASASTAKETAKTAHLADTADAALKTDYETKLEDFNAAEISALESQVLAAQAYAAAANAQALSNTIAADATVVTFDVHATYAVAAATAAQTAAEKAKTLAEYFQIATENYLLALDTSGAATSNSRAASAATFAASADAAVNKANTALVSIKASFDAALTANPSDGTLTAMQGDIATAETSMASSVTAALTSSTSAETAKMLSQAAVDGNGNPVYGTTATSALASATTHAATVNTKFTETDTAVTAVDESAANAAVVEAETAAGLAKTQYYIARSAMRISEVIKNNAYTALQDDTSDAVLIATHDTALEDFNVARIKTSQTEAQYVNAINEVVKAKILTTTLVADKTTVNYLAIATEGETTVGLALTAATTARDLAAAFKTEVDTYVADSNSSKASTANDRTALAYDAANLALTAIGLGFTALTDTRQATFDLYFANQSDATIQANYNAVDIIKNNAASVQTDATDNVVPAALTSKTDADSAFNGMRRLLQQQSWSSSKRAEMSEWLVGPHKGRLLGKHDCPDNTICVTNENLVDPDVYLTKNSYVTGEGGCKFVCESTINPKPTPVNDQATDPNGVNACYNSCSVADSLERCVNGECVKNCQVSDPGLTINCNVNEDCIVGVGGADNTCLSKPCDPACDENYETCDPATNTCSLQARKPKIQALTTCTKVENCDAKYHLNKCYQCLNYYSFKIEATGNTTASPNTVTPELTANEIPSCINTNIPNALMASEYLDVDVTRYKVEKCAPGYDLDFNNNECVSQVKNCKLNSVDGDCLGCDTPYETAAVQLVFGIFEKGYCKTWGEFTTDEQAILTPPYQEFCKYYRYTYNSTNSANVNSLKDGSSVCFACDPNYYFANSGAGETCTLKRTMNCKVYDATDLTGVCNECEIGFELKNQGAPNQECKEIINSTRKIPGCKTYDLQLNCLACETGYLFRATGEGTDQTGYCFIEFVDDACTIQNETVFAANGAIECKKCTKVQGIYYYPRKFNTPINACMFIGERRLCLNHDFDRADSLALTNDFKCTLCEGDYYLKNGVCIRRLNTNLRDCIEYNPTEDSCKTYESSATVNIGSDEFSTEIESVQNLLLNPPDYLSSTKTIDFGGWILSCEVYQDETVCSRCFAPKYINPFGFEYNTKCITASVVINDCIYYSDASTCQECFPGYQLISNQCHLITVENCATYESQNKCGSCPANFPYLDNDGNCTVDPRNMFCLTYIISNDAVNLQASKIFECDICMESYYPDDSSICTMVETEIQNCKYYAGDGLCKECRDGFYLNFNGKNCFINPSFDPFCKSFTYITDCAVCEKGYYLDADGFCVACNVEIFPAGCMYCDPADNAICLMCNFGFQMKAEGCVADPSVSADTEPFMRPFSYFIGQTKVVTTAEVVKVAK